MASDTEEYAWVVTAAEAGVRLDRFLTQRDALGSRSQVTRLIAEGCVLVGAKSVKAGTVLRQGDQVVVRRAAPAPQTAQPEAIELDALYEDAWLLAINKPAGLVVHPAPGHWEGTLVSALLHRWPAAATGLDPSRLGIAHRLDKDTSGVLLVARTAACLAELGRQFRERAVKKQYLALVWGAPRSERGEIGEPIGRHPVDRKRMAINTRGRAAVTRYQVVERFRRSALLRVYPETGRTHQIRVHLAAIGHPIVADPLYARSHADRPSGLTRQALHAEAIAFRHPHSGEPLRLKAPLAADLRAVLRDLRLTSLDKKSGLH